MEINIHTPRIRAGKCARNVQIGETTPERLGQSIEINLWVVPDDSMTTLSQRAREEAIAFLERALVFLRDDQKLVGAEH